MTDNASEYGRLLAERDRLIASGVDPSGLGMPLRPLLPAPDERQAGLREALRRVVESHERREPHPCTCIACQEGRAALALAQVPAEEERLPSWLTPERLAQAMSDSKAVPLGYGLPDTARRILRALSPRKEPSDD